MIDQFTQFSLASQNQYAENQFTKSLSNTTKISKLDSLFLVNFKSFKKRYVGPFLNFTSIVGPNGSGKSNILEALIFCFCNQHVRNNVFENRELIYRQGRETYREMMQNKKVCSVEARFQLQDKTTLVFSRTVNGEGHETFSINHEQVEKHFYQNFLLTKGIVFYTPNYAIWQGEIDKLLLKQPMQFTKMFENLSGSIQLKKKYEETYQDVQSLHEQIQDKTNKIRKLKLTKRNVQIVKEANLSYEKLDKKLQDLMEKLYLIKVSEKQIQLKIKQEEIQKIKDKEERKKQQVLQFKAKAQENYESKCEIQEKMNDLIRVINLKRNTLKKAADPVQLLQNHKLHDIEKNLDNLQQEFEVLEKKQQILNSSLPNIPSSAMIDEYSELFVKLEEENLGLTRQFQKKNGEMLYVQSLIQMKEQLVRDNENKILQFQGRVQENQKEKKTIVHEIKELQKILNHMKVQEDRMGEKMYLGKQKLDKKRKQLENLSINIQNLQSLIEEDADNEKEKEMFRRLSTISGFYGILGQKIRPVSQKYEGCFAEIFSGVFKYLLCSNQQTSFQMGERLKEINQLKHVVILENAKKRSSDELNRKLGKFGHLAVDIVEYDRSIEGLSFFLEDYLYGKVVCNDMRSAFELKKKGIQPIREIYTLDGVVLRRDGSVSAHGNPESLKRTYKYTQNKSALYNDMGKLQKEKAKLESELSSLSSEYENQSIINRNMEYQKLSQKLKQLERKKENLHHMKIKRPQIPKHIETQIKDLSTKKNKIQKTLKQIQQMMQDSKVFSGFLKKYKIENLEEFRNSHNLENLELMMKKRNKINKQIHEIRDQKSEWKEKIQKCKQKREQIRKQLQSLPSNSEKKDIEKSLKENEEQMISLRNKIAKITPVAKNKLEFISQVSGLLGNLDFMRSKIKKELQEVAEEYGVLFKYPIPHDELEEELEVKFERLTLKKLEALQEKTILEKNKIQEKLEKQNGLYLFHKPVHSNDKNVSEDITESQNEVKELIEKRKQLVQQLENIRGERKSTLSNFVKKVRQILIQTYRILTKPQKGGGDPGSADIIFQNEHLPFENGIYYMPTPPGKRMINDLEQLSGGEKSIASLALQFAIAMVTQAPFLILDEIDAFLDLNNVRRFYNLIKQKTKENKFQIIIITHKEGLYSHSESLVGVSKKGNYSEAFSLKLSDYA